VNKSAVHIEIPEAQEHCPMFGIQPSTPVRLLPKRRGPKDRGLHEQIHVQVTPELKEWLLNQQENIGVVVRRILQEEYDRQHAGR
jgi:hypothetical protein